MVLIIGLSIIMKKMTGGHRDIYIYIGIPFDFPEDFIKKNIVDTSTDKDKQFEQIMAILQTDSVFWRIL